jgi:D-alanine-D-alanine ligase-like ATP-grasp enzyme
MIGNPEPNDFVCYIHYVVKRVSTGETRFQKGVAVKVSSEEELKQKTETLRKELDLIVEECYRYPVFIIESRTRFPLEYFEDKK